MSVALSVVCAESFVVVAVEVRVVMCVFFFVHDRVRNVRESTNVRCWSSVMGGKGKEILYLYTLESSCTPNTNPPPKKKVISGAKQSHKKIPAHKVFFIYW